MSINLIIWSFFFALLLGSIWLLVRALRSKRRIGKIAGAAGSLVLILLFGAVTFTAGKGLWMMLVPTAAVPDLQVEITPERVRRGEYLASVTCAGCHAVDGQRGQPLTGGLDLSTEIPMPVGAMIAQNITPGGILAQRSDGELFRLLRYGYNGDGQASPVMISLPIRELSDEDIYAVIAYLRSLEPLESEGTRGSRPNFLAALLVGAGMLPVQGPTDGVINAPPAGETAEYGKYVASFGDCRYCHGPDMTGTPPSMTVPNGYPNVRLALSAWTLEQFMQTMRTGVRPSGLELNMPWENAAHMSDADLAALYNYLREPQSGY